MILTNISPRNYLVLLTSPKLLPPTFLLHLFLPSTSRAIRNHTHYPAIIPSITDLIASILITGCSRWVPSSDAFERRRAIVTHARRQRGIATGVDTSIAACKCDVGVA